MTERLLSIDLEKVGPTHAIAALEAAAAAAINRIDAELWQLHLKYEDKEDVDVEVPHVATLFARAILKDKDTVEGLNDKDVAALHKLAQKDDGSSL